MAVVDMSVHSHSLILVKNLDIKNQWHLDEKMELMFSCIIFMQALNYIRYILVGLRLSWYKQYDENFQSQEERKRDHISYSRSMDLTEEQRQILYELQDLYEEKNDGAEKRRLTSVSSFSDFESGPSRRAVSHAYS